MPVISRTCARGLIPVLVVLAGPSLLGAAQAGAQQPLPDARAHHQLVYDEAERLVYLVGGSTRTSSGYHYFDDVWTWDGGDWIRAGSLPFPRSSHRVVYHAGRRSLILFGGGFGQAVKAEGVVWERRDGEWRAVGGHAEAGRDEPGLCYDRRRDRVVLFGGWDRGSTFRGDTWELSGVDLVRVDSTGPSPRAGHAFLYDPVRERCLLFGGRGPEGYLADTWEWDGDGWARLPASGPQERWFFGSATDDENERVVIFGGSGAEGDLADTWAWDGSRWKPLDAEGPEARGMAKLAFTGRNLVLFGGRRMITEGFVDHQDTWVLVGDTWERRR
jgi:hypothetical protein